MASEGQCPGEKVDAPTNVASIDSFQGDKLTPPGSLLRQAHHQIEKSQGTPPHALGIPPSPFVVVIQLLSRIQLFVTPRNAARLSLTISWSLLKFMSTESVMPSNRLILCHPLLLLPSIVLSIRVFSSESALHIRWPKYWSFSFSISPSNEYSGLISFRDKIRQNSPSFQNKFSF